MTRHRYPTSALLADYARACLGLALTLPPLLLVALAPVVAAILAVLAALFAGFAARTLACQLGAIELDETGIARTGPRYRRIAWDALRRVRLRWFGARRDRGGGFMQLVVAGGGRRIAIDSRIDGFEAIATAVAHAARRRRLPLGEATADNFAALGITVEEDCVDA